MKLEFCQFPSSKRTEMELDGVPPAIAACWRSSLVTSACTSALVAGHDYSSALTNRWRLEHHVHGARGGEAVFLLHTH
jgi:hypothetical protein